MKGNPLLSVHQAQGSGVARGEGEIGGLDLLHDLPRCGVGSTRTGRMHMSWSSSLPLSAIGGQQGAPIVGSQLPLAQVGASHQEIQGVTHTVQVGLLQLEPVV